MQNEVKAGQLAAAMKLIQPTLTALGRGDVPLVVLKVAGQRAVVPDRDLSIFASTFSNKDAPVSILPAGDVDKDFEAALSVLLQWHTGQMELYCERELRFMDARKRQAMLGVEFDLRDLVVLATSPGKPTEKALALAKKLLPEGEELRTGSTEKQKKIERLRAKVKKLEGEIESAQVGVEQSLRYAGASTAGIKRARALYSERMDALGWIARCLRGGREVEMREKIDSFTPALPAALRAEAEEIVKIPFAHKLKRAEAVIDWHHSVERWIKLVMGCERAYIYHTQLPKSRVVEQMDELLKEGGHWFAGEFKRRLAFEEKAEWWQNAAQENKDRLFRAQADLGVARLKLAKLEGAEQLTEINKEE